MTGTDLTFANAPLQDRIQWSKAIAGAGNLVPAGFRDGPNANPAKILLAVEYGAMLGLHPMAALSGIHVLDGKPTLSAALMSALVHKAGHKLRITSTGSVTGEGAKMAGDFTVTATLIRADDNHHPFICTWTIDRAKRASLWGRGNWLKYPENQMTWRAVSEVTKLGAPEVLSGVWHTPDELGATVDEDGDVIEGEIVEQDHDGPAVSNLMRSNSGAGASTVGKTEARQRDAGDAASDEQRTRPAATGKGRGRPESPVATPTTPAKDPREKAVVAAEWIDRVRDTNALTALFKLHDEAANRGVLDHHAGDIDGGQAPTVEDIFLMRRTQLQQAAAGEPEPTIILDGPESTFDGEPVY